MRRLHHLLLIATLILAAGIATTALAAVPVTVTVSVTGDPAPGATVTAKANVTINDGSVLQSVTWKQTGGLPAVRAHPTARTVTPHPPDRQTFQDELPTILEASPNSR